MKKKYKVVTDKLKYAKEGILIEYDKEVDEYFEIGKTSYGIPRSVVENNKDWFEEIKDIRSEIISELYALRNKHTTNGDNRLPELCELFIKHLKDLN